LSPLLALFLAAASPVSLRSRRWRKPSRQPAATRPRAKPKGKALVDLNGMTLYVFDRDGSGKSNCNAQCAVSWLPLIADTDAQASGSFSFISRDDGRKQWAYKGKPLYTWTKDKKPGDATGDGVNKVWHVASP
jgi:predicted lipoprotein with Yx(FWY)xxD motif